MHGGAVLPGSTRDVELVLAASDHHPDDDRSWVQRLLEARVDGLLPTPGEPPARSRPCGTLPGWGTATPRWSSGGRRPAAGSPGGYDAAVAALDLSTTASRHEHRTQEGIARRLDDIPDGFAAAGVTAVPAHPGDVANQVLQRARPWWSAPRRPRRARRRALRRTQAQPCRARPAAGPGRGASTARRHRSPNRRAIPPVRWFEPPAAGQTSRWRRGRGESGRAIRPSRPQWTRGLPGTTLRRPAPAGRNS
ncbi:hypothetical protein AB0I60_03535 [Actinosynnema sp. NPDC050436]|uniref:hypothetical protein n=1 Tax=Actinosynnema sp. NPDC050436 TaxID=3155659 RepID=UPI0033DB13E8